MEEFTGPRTYLDVMSGTGARGLRIAHELNPDCVFINDVNVHGIDLARQGSALNNLSNVKFSQYEACRFLSNHSGRGERGAMVDVDPFGSPAPYMDCAIRATAHRGMVSFTATDLQVLGGLHNAACNRIYGGVPIRVSYGAEVAVRLILGCADSVAGRLGKQIVPLYTESHMHYYRVYLKIKPGADSHRGYAIHCNACGYRCMVQHRVRYCDVCGQVTTVAGPLWVGRLFDEAFVQVMISIDHDKSDGVYDSMLEKCKSEAYLPGLFYTLDEVASRVKTGPPRLVDMIKGLHSMGFNASPTSFSPTGFRTNAKISDICGIMDLVKSHTDQV